MSTRDHQALSRRSHEEQEGTRQRTAMDRGMEKQGPDWRQRAKGLTLTGASQGMWTGNLARSQPPYGTHVTPLGPKGQGELVLGSCLPGSPRQFQATSAMLGAPAALDQGQQGTFPGNSPQPACLPPQALKSPGAIPSRSPRPRGRAEYLGFPF